MICVPPSRSRASFGAQPPAPERDARAEQRGEAHDDDHEPGQRSPGLADRRRSRRCHVAVLLSVSWRGSAAAFGRRADAEPTGGPGQHPRVLTTRRPSCARRAWASRRRRARRTRARRSRGGRGSHRGLDRRGVGGFVVILDDVFLGDDRVDHAGDRLTVHAKTRAGRGLDDRLVLLFVDRDEGAEDAELRHHLGTGLQLGLHLLGVATALARVAEHEEDHDGQKRRGGR